MIHSITQGTKYTYTVGKKSETIRNPITRITKEGTNYVIYTKPEGEEEDWVMKLDEKWVSDVRDEHGVCIK